MKIKKGDKVLVIAGNGRGETGEVLEVLKSKNKVVVEGVNIVKKHVKPSQVNPEGQIIEFAAPIHVSNVMLFDEKAKTGTRVGYKVEENKKFRFSKKSQTNLDK